MNAKEIVNEGNLILDVLFEEVSLLFDHHGHGFNPF